MRKGLQKRTRELEKVSRWLQRKGWTVTKLALEVEESETGMNPWGTLVARYDPEKETDVL